MPKVLIVEDDQMLGDMYSSKFQADGFTVLRASDGAEGLKLAQAERPDAILLDVIMPKLDGFATLQQLKADKALAKIPVIMLTNLGQDEDIKKGKELGAADYFVKANQTPSEIVTKVKTLIGS
ncbi:MAG: response regulator [Candidatus Kerfeldbacteria bacterium]|nr:response regulator [Candidatus Kerfeldbacteria bacterium]